VVSRTTRAPLCAETWVRRGAITAIPVVLAALVATVVGLNDLQETRWFDPDRRYR
jgi:hypothetical protein